MDAEIDHIEAVAVVGLACRVPGAEDPAAFWRDVWAGSESITRFSPDELRAAGVPDAVLADPAYVPAGGWLAGIDRFDAGLFGMSAREAEAMDPQHRIFLECVWSALEDAGTVPESPHRTGVFACASPNDWSARLPRVDGLIETLGLDQLMLGVERDFLVSRVAYRLGATGPALAVQTACSSSLAAVHLAARSLLTLECDVAVAGGVSVTILDPVGYWHEHGGVRSPDGRCRAFDSAAEGTVAGNGAGVVVLKRLADAVADGDSVRAVLRGTAMNNDGSVRAGFTAPSARGQAAVVAEALAVAGVSAEDVDYVEAHGTGTAIGDPIELTALGEVFGGRAADPVLVGSVKPNIGHLDAASGVVSLIKTVLAVEAGLVPPTIHVRRPTEAVDWRALGITPNTEPRPWPVHGDRPRRAGVNAFGIGGTNVHVIVESAPPGTGVPLDPAQADRRSVPAGQWGSAGHLLAAGPVPERAAQAAEIAPEIARQAAEIAPEIAGQTPEITPEIVTVSGVDDSAVERGIDALRGFAGRARGSVRLSDVAATTRTGRTALAGRAAAVCGSLGELAALDPSSWLRGHADSSAVVLLFPDQQALYPGAGSGLYRSEPVFRSAVDSCAELLAVDVRDVLLDRGDHAGEPWLAQPALFVLEYALARLWRHWGVSPLATIGCGVGEFVSACLAGVLSVPDAMRAVSERGRLLHAAARQPAVEEFTKVMADVALIPPDRPFMSTVSGAVADPGEVTDPEHWGRQPWAPVRLAEAVRGLTAVDGLARPLLIEAGPGTTLTGVDAIPSLPPASARTGPADDRIAARRAVAAAWVRGASVDWARHGSSGDATRKVPLPTYPFARQRHWPEGLPRATSQSGVYVAAPPDPVRRPADPVPRPAEPTAGHDEVFEFLVESWRDLLGASDVHGDSDFFELGGESLLAIRLTERLRRRFGLRIPPTQLFDTPTVDSLAAVVRGNGPAPADVVTDLVEEITRVAEGRGHG